MEVLEVKGDLIFQKLLSSVGFLKPYLFLGILVTNANDNDSFLYYLRFLQLQENYLYDGF